MSEKAIDSIIVVLEGGPGSGFHGHRGRPGQVGGSVARGGAGEARGGEYILPQSGKKLSSYAVLADQPMAPGRRVFEEDELLPDGSPYSEESFVEYVRAHGLLWRDELAVQVWWANASSENESLLFQKAVAEIAGLPISENLKTRMRAIGIDPDKPLSEIGKNEWEELLKQIEKTRQYSLPKSLFVSRQNLMKVARLNYEYTQEQLAAKGVKPDDLIHVYRGVSRPVDADEWRNLSAGDVVDYNANPLTSWTLSTRTANGFSHPFGVATDRGWNLYVLEGYVPRKAVYGFAGDGLGVFDEKEVVVFGDTLNHKAKIVRKESW